MQVKNYFPKNKVLHNGEVMRFIEVPIYEAKKVKQHLNQIEHLKEINQLTFKNESGVLINCNLADDGLEAAAYLNLKMYLERDDGLVLGDVENVDYHEALHAQGNQSEDNCGNDFEENCRDDFEDDLAEEIENETQEESEALRDRIQKEVKDFLTAKDGFLRLPIVDSAEYKLHRNYKMPPGFNTRGMMHPLEPNIQYPKPYWYQDTYPLVVIWQKWNNFHHSLIEVADFSNETRLITIVNENWLSDEFASVSSFNSFSLNIAFELNFEVFRMPEPGIAYYKTILLSKLEEKGYSVSRSVDLNTVIENLKRFRGFQFRGTLDIARFVERTISKSKSDSLTLKLRDFERVINIDPSVVTKSPVGIKKDIDHLIGLKSVKEQIARMVESMLFEKKRAKQLNLSTQTHLSAVFIGNPGTAKTTVARYLGELLVEKNCIMNNVFREVTRKDLVGQFVGWTSMKVAKVFSEVKGGVLFIDEAYSLLNETGRDLFADEAINEIIFQMENNPDTLVIFAGYPSEMAHFIQNANPGLRSRLAAVIRFKDYSANEMVSIFNQFVINEQYVLSDESASSAILENMISRINLMKNSNMGNGRLMRKVFKKAITFKASRKDNDFVTLIPSDIQQACEEVYTSEHAQKGHNKEEKVIGF